MGTASRFIKDMFEARSKAPVCIASYANEGKSLAPAEIYTRNPEEVERFLKRYDKPGRAVYFSVNTIKDGKKRSKENVAEITALHADLDFKGIIEERREIEAVLARLPLKVSRIVFSGHGLHVYWWLQASSVLADRIEAALKRLCWALSGDPAVCEVARVMRLPGSHNSKFDEWRRVVVVHKNDVVYTLEQLEAWLAGINAPLLQRRGSKGNGSAPSGDPFAMAADEQTSSGPIDVEQVLSEMQYHGSDGNSINFTQWRVIGSLLYEGIPVDEAIDYIVAETWRIIPESANWSQKEEIESIRDMCVRTFRKHPEHLEAQSIRPLWLERRLGDGQHKPEPPKASLNALYAEDLEQHPLLKREWIVGDFILAWQLNGLFGDGGMGKDLILLQLAIAMTTDQQWLGQDVMQGKVLYFPVEDDVEELKRRQFAINKYYDIKASDYPQRLKIVPMIGEETILAVFDSKSGLVRPTPLYDSVCREVDEFKPTLVIVGNRVNIFGVNQNEDSQARQCLGLLSRLCVRYHTTVIMPGHVSLRGQSSGEGTSGTVQWSNGVRSRCYLRYPEKEEGDDKPDTSRRELEVMKINYAPTGTVISMQWTPVEEPGHRLGVYATDSIRIVKSQPKPLEGETERQAWTRTEKEKQDADDAEFLRTLDRHFKLSSFVSAAPTAHTNAPNIFSKDEECLSGVRVTEKKKRMKAAMMRLFARNVIHTVQWDNPSRSKFRIERVGLKVVE